MLLNIFFLNWKRDRVGIGAADRGAVLMDNRAVFMRLGEDISFKEDRLEVRELRVGTFIAEQKAVQKTGIVLVGAAVLHEFKFFFK